MIFNNLFNAILRTDFSSFIHKVFNTINPGTKFSPNWHIDLISDYLDNVRSGNIKRLIINIPPRCLKSVCVSVAFPCFLLGRNPATRIMAASYSQALSNKHSIDSRLVMQSVWYRNIFPQTEIIYNQKNKFITSKLGFRFATSVGGVATGEGADYLIIDDPHNPTYIYSEKMRNKTIDWYEQTFSTRLNDKALGVIIIVMQRLHTEDLCGYLMQKNNWEVLKIPAITKNNLEFRINSKTYVFKQNDTIHAERELYEELKKLENDIGARNFEAQYMQEPIDIKSNLVEKFTYYVDTPLKFESIVQSWDTAIKASNHADFSVCTTWGFLDGKYYLIDLFRKRIGYAEIRNAILLLYRQFEPFFVLVEDKGSGQSLIQELQNDIRIIPVRPKFDKLTRFMSVVHLFESGKVLIPENKTWIREFVFEIMHFPNSKHDDIVDTVSQFLNHIITNNKKIIRVR